MPRYHFFALLVAILFSSQVAIGETRFRNLDSDISETVLDHHQQGKWLVVMIWASDCVACNSEAHQYVAFHAKHRDTTAIVLGLNMDGAGKKIEAEAFVDRHHVNFSNLTGEWQEVVTFYQELTSTDWIGTPSFLVFSPQGGLTVKQVGAVPADLIEQYIRQQGSS